MLSREDVVYAYRLLLGREPESETVVNHYATEAQNLKALRELFVNSPEFREKVANHLAPRTSRPPFSGPPMQVDINVSVDDLAALFSKTAKQWEHLGRTEPHWSVITNPNYLQERYKGNETAFYSSGESECKMFDAALARAGVKPNPAGICLELGCGVGRVTDALARRYASVIGVDISASHLAIAQAYNHEHNIANVQLRHLARLEQVASLGEFDVLYSRIVLQHNPPPIIGWLLKRLFSQLREGGIAYLQIPVYKAGYRFRLAEYLKEQNHTDMEVHYFPQAALLQLIMESGCRILELREDDAIGISATALSNTLLVQKR